MFSMARKSLGAACCGLLSLSLSPLPGRAEPDLFNYNWASAVSGSIDDPSKWSPSGVPGAQDNLNFGVPGTYAVTFPATVAQTSIVTVGAGAVTFNATSPHSTSELNVVLPNGSHSLTVSQGAFFVDHLQFGVSGGFSTMTLTNRAQLHSRSVGNPNQGGLGDHVGHGGISELYVSGGARYYSNREDDSHWPLEMASLSGSASSMFVAGLATFPTSYSGLVLTGGATMIVGVAGSANLFASNGGFIDVTGRVMIARDQSANGYVTIGPSSLATSFLRASSDLWIGRNAGIEAGHAEVTVRNNAWVSVAGSCEVGDPDNDRGSILRVYDGGRFYADGGLKFWPTTAQPLDLQGGLLHVRGGAFTWPAGKILSIASESGNPELRITNGIANTGPSMPAFNAQLSLGRAGYGTLRLAGAGTTLQTGLGATTLGELLNGVGLLEVDSTATFSSGGPLNVGVNGSGVMNVLHASFADVGTAAVAIVPGNYAAVVVADAGSLLRVRDNFWVGGGFGGPGGDGNVTVETDATIEILQTGINPALMTIYAPGMVTARHGGRIVTTGTVSNSGELIIEDGVITALNVSQPVSGVLRGSGILNAMLQNSGAVDPEPESGSMGGIHVNGSFTQFGAGHLIVDLDTSSGPDCDTLLVSGSATLDGTLDIRTGPGFAADPGDEFTIIRCGSRAGTFSSVTWNGSPLAGEAVISYQSDHVRIVVGGQVSVESETETAAPHGVMLAAAGGVRLGFVLEIPDEASVHLKLFDVRGREVATLFEGTLGPGRHSIAGASRRELPSGAYFARAVVESEGRVVVRTARSVHVR